MSYVATKSKFHVALNGNGLILQGAPDRLAYEMKQAPVYGNRFAQGDRSYNDLSFWWYFVQTSWSGGLKDVVSWADDAKFYYSTNIDTLSENGAIKLHHIQTLDNTFSLNVACGTFGEIGGTPTKIIGTYGSGSTSLTAKIWAQTTGSWTDITPAGGFEGNIIKSVEIANGILWVTSAFQDSAFTTAAGVKMIYSYDGTTWTDRTASMITALGGGLSLWGVMWTKTVGANTYVGVNTLTKAYIAMFNGSAWSSILSKTTTKIITDGEEYGGNIYYLLNTRTINAAIGFELRIYDPVALTDTSVYKWNGLLGINLGFRLGKFLISEFGKLIISIGYNPGEVWSYNGSTMERIWSADSKKIDISFLIAPGNVSMGGVVKDNKIYWHNLIYDGTSFHNWIKDVADDESVTYFYSPVFTYQSTIYGRDNNDPTRLYKDNSSSYKGTADKNYVVFSNFDLISSIDKLAYSATVLFKPMVSGQAIVIEYLLEDLNSSSSWTVLGTASFALDGGVVTDKTLYFAAGVTFKKVWFRIKMQGGGSDTPTMNDFIVQYLPVPVYKKNWVLNINCGDEVKRLDGALVETVGRELRGILEQAWWTKSVLDFQDLDYATTLVNDASFEAGDTTITVDDTYDFPEQGRIRIDNEEITYTGKTPTTFTGCTRGARETRAVAHNNDSVVNNAYKVILTDFQYRVPIALEDKELEYVVGISLREV